MVYLVGQGVVKGLSKAYLDEYKSDQEERELSGQRKSLMGMRDVYIAQW